MPMTPSAGVPPASTLSAGTLAGIEGKFEHFPTPYFIAPGLTPSNFYRENGLIILACVVALMLLILFFMAGPLFGTAILNDPVSS